MIRYILMTILTVFVVLFAINVNNKYDKNYYNNSTPISITNVISDKEDKD